MTTKERAEAGRERQKKEKPNLETRESISARAEALAEETRHRLDFIIQLFPIPEKL